MNRRQLAALALAVMVAGLAVREGLSMPAFARRYGVSCAQCPPTCNPLPPSTERAHDTGRESSC